MSSLSSGSAVRLEIASDPRHLCLVRTMVRSFAHLGGFAGRQLDRIALAVDEACANVIRHAHGGRFDGDMTVTCAIENAASLGRENAASPARFLVVRVQDHGTPPPGGVLTVPECPDPLVPLVPGGLGLRLMHDIMDAVTFRCGAGGNELELIVACPAEEPPAG